MAQSWACCWRFQGVHCFQLYFLFWVPSHIIFPFHVSFECFHLWFSKWRFLSSFVFITLSGNITTCVLSKSEKATPLWLQAGNSEINLDRENSLLYVSLNTQASKASTKHPSSYSIISSSLVSMKYVVIWVVYTNLGNLGEAIWAILAVCNHLGNLNLVYNNLGGTVYNNLSGVEQPE